MTVRSRVDELMASLQSEMSRVGGKLSGLNSEQIWGNSRNNTIDGNYTPHKEGTIIMSNAAKNITNENNDDSKSSLPPAGGAHEQEIATQVVSFLSQMGIVQAPKRSWKEKALDQAVPTAVTVATVLAVQGAIALVSHGVGKYQAKKKLAAEQKALLAAPGDLSNVG